MSDNITQKWLIVVLIYANFTDTKDNREGDAFLALNSMFSDFMDTALNPETCRLCVLMDSISTITIADTKYVQNTIAKYTIEKAEDSSLNKIGECVLLFDQQMQVSSTSAGTRGNRHKFQRIDALAEVLDEVIVQEGEHILFITWDHGAGYGIFPAGQLQLNTVEPIPFEEKLKQYPFLELFWNYAFSKSAIKKILPDEKPDEQPATFEILENYELSAAISKWLSKYKQAYVDVLLMTNCWMMNMHTMFEMKNIARCLVAPQSQISIPAYNFSGIIAFINKSHQQVTAEDCTLSVARHCIESRNTESFRRKIISLNLGIINPVNEVIDNCVILAIDLQKLDSNGKRILDNQFEALKKFVGDLRSMALDVTQGDSIKGFIRCARALTYDFKTTNIYLVDINNFIKTLGYINQHLMLQYPPLGNIIKDYCTKMGPGAAKIVGHGINEPFIKDEAYMIPRPTGYSLFFRLGRTKAVDEKVKQCVVSDKLLTNFMPEWMDLLTLVFGE